MLVMSELTAIQVALARMEERQIAQSDKLDTLASKESVERVSDRVAGLERDRKYILSGLVSVAVSAVSGVVLYFRSKFGA